MHTAVAGVGCAFGGGIAATVTLGIGAAAGCLGGMAYTEAVYGAGSYGVQVAKGLGSAYQGQYGSSAIQIVTATAEQLAGKKVAGKQVPVWSMKLVGVPVGYFLGSFYENVPAP